MLPFTHDQFLAVFATYNAAIWPVQLVAWMLGFVAVALVFLRRARAGQAIAAVLAVMWLWTGVAYHALAFAPVNPAAYGFAALFVLQAVALFHAGVLRNRLEFAFRSDLRGILGMALVGYALIVYPLIGLGLGQAAGELPWFGVTPCPVTLYTLGWLLLTKGRPWALLVVPVIWSLIGGTAAFLLAVPQDWPLLIAGPVVILVMLYGTRNPEAAGSGVK